eukprot:CAMPEP_0167760824 /NCGR_PEP_ID=MMETSP0110_2-20121227/11806_1 /TAXON_ID=629695 /ORGANISM="Gymnochlora sp., Strain CCMP2014" /LENGTH=345 /DNA_ID=CAMNT_0007647389 /DNA_START=1 /DNA_END=1035 /DNA_ORIENTATION=+
MSKSESTLSKIKLEAARKWIKNAKHVLIVAGAGMSIYDKTQPGMNVYTNPDDFKKHYPKLLKYGPKTSYECMGFFGSSAPKEAIQGYLYTHIGNMRYKFPPNPGYSHLLSLLNGKDYFVVTSNVDGNFVRSGFDKKRIYTPQGDWSVLQCATPCSKDIYDAKTIIDKLKGKMEGGVFKDAKDIPRCPRCGGYLMGNVRGGSWFLHDHWMKDQKNAISWVNEVKESKEKCAVIEIGAGFNTPTVTRFPAESIARDLNCAFVRVNPSDSHVPLDIKAVGIPEGWHVLQQLQKNANNEIKKNGKDKDAEKLLADRADKMKKHMEKSGLMERWKVYEYRLGHFDWEKFW